MYNLYASTQNIHQFNANVKPLIQQVWNEHSDIMFHILIPDNGDHTPDEHDLYSLLMGISGYNKCHAYVYVCFFLRVS